MGPTLLWLCRFCLPSCPEHEFSEDRAVASWLSHGTCGCSTTLCTSSSVLSKNLEIITSSMIGNIFIWMRFSLPCPWAFFYPWSRIAWFESQILLISCVIWGKWYFLFEPQFHYVQNGNSNDIYLIELLWELNEVIKMSIIIIIGNIDRALTIRHFSKCFTCINSFNYQRNSTGKVMSFIHW